MNKIIDIEILKARRWFRQGDPETLRMAHQLKTRCDVNLYRLSREDIPRVFDDIVAANRAILLSSKECRDAVAEYISAHDAYTEDELESFILKWIEERQVVKMIGV